MRKGCRELLRRVDVKSCVRHVERNNLGIGFQDAAGATITLQGSKPFEISGWKNRRNADGLLIARGDGSVWIHRSNIEQALVVSAVEERLIAQGNQHSRCSTR